MGRRKRGKETNRYGKRGKLKKKMVKEKDREWNTEERRNGEGRILMKGGKGNKQNNRRAKYKKERN